MKKLTSVLLSVVMLMSVLCTGALAANQNDYLEPTVTVYQNANAVYLTFTAVRDTTNGKFTVEFDSRCLQYYEAEVDGMLTDITVNKNTVTFGYASSTAGTIPAGQVIATLMFDITRAQTNSPISITIHEFNAQERLELALPVILLDLPEPVNNTTPVPPSDPVDPKPPVDDPDDGKDDEQDKPGIEIGIEIPEMTEEKYESIVAQYTDIPQDWATDYIVEAVNAGLFNGTSDNTFSPDAKMTRAQLMTVLARLAGVDTTVGATWYEKGMEWSKENGISDGSNPNKNITRQELVTMLYRFAGEPAANGSLAAFTDASSVSGYAVDAMKWAVENGIINGMGDGTLAPQGEATRAQMAKILMTFINL